MVLAGDLRRLLPPGAVIDRPEQLKTYECDGLTGHRVVPSLVVLPETTEQVQAVVRVCHAAGVPFVARGGKSLESPGPDLLGAFVGSEGTLGIATEITLRVLPRPECVRTVLAAFDSTDAAGAAVSGIVAARILPAAVEMMDRLTIEAAEAAGHPGYPDAGAILLVELDGCFPQVEEDLAAVESICRSCGSWEIRIAP